MITILRICVVLVIALLLNVSSLGAEANTEGNTGSDHLSPYWGGAISQWGRLILYWSNLREIDPDLVAAVIRKESIGRADAQGPQGATGLMMVMPAEASGLSWRPSAEQLKQPSLNLRWGTGILREIIEDSDGNLKSALAAYNGGWDQLHLTVTEEYAQSVLTYYAYALAARHGYSYQDSEIWSLVLMKRVDGRIKLIQNASSGHFLVPCFQGAVPFREIFPSMASAPRSQVAHYVDAQGHDVRIDAWLFVGQPSRPSGETQISAGPLILPRAGHKP